MPWISSARTSSAVDTRRRRAWRAAVSTEMTTSPSTAPSPATRAPSRIAKASTWYLLARREDGELRTYGAGLLSSYAEIELFRDAEIRQLDIGAMGSTAYDITHYQPLLFAASSFAHATDALSAFFERYDDDAFARLAAAA